MKTLILVLFLLQATGDTSKVKVDYNKIAQKTTQINKQLAHSSMHTTEDVYLLLLKAGKTLNESHHLSGVLLAKQDSAARVLAQANFNVKVLLDRNKDLKEELVVYKDDSKQLAVIHEIMQIGVELFLMGFVVWLFAHLFYYLLIPKRLKLKT